MSSGWNTVETPMCLNGFRSIIRIGSTLITSTIRYRLLQTICTSTSAWKWLLSFSKILHCQLHSQNYWYVHFHSVWWWLLSCRKILHCLLHSDAFYWHVYFHSVWWWLVSYRKIIHDRLHSDTFYGYVRFHSVWCSLMSYRKILHVSPAFRRLLLPFVLPLSLMVIVILNSVFALLHWNNTIYYDDICSHATHTALSIEVLHWDTFYCYWCTGPLSLMVIVVLHYKHTVATAISTSTKPDDEKCPNHSVHILLLFVLPLSLMVIAVLHSDTSYCYMYFQH